MYSEVADGNLTGGSSSRWDSISFTYRRMIALFIDSPTALRSDHGEFAAAAAYSVYAPYNCRYSADSGIELDEVLEVYDHMMASGYLFTFEIVQ